MVHRIGITAGAVIAAIIASTARAGEIKKFDFTQPKMGTVFHLVLYTDDQAKADAAAAAAWKRVDELNRTLSDYDPQSELSRLSQRTDDGPMSEPVKVSDDLWRVLTRSVEAAKLSDGAFDVTVGPYVRLWRRARQTRTLPDPADLQAAKAAVGYEKIKLDEKTHGVQLLAQHMRLDLGGIAKGYTAGQALAVLKKRGIDRALFGAAGDLAAGDPPPGREYWRVAIQSLEAPDQTAGYVRLANAAVSTSGDTYRFVEIGGKRYSHIVDSKTGMGLTDRIGATVIAPDPVTSDWMATALCAMGPEKGLALADRTPATAGRIVTIDGAAKAKVFESSRWKDFVIHPELEK